MTVHNVALVATQGMFLGLARQNMLFHQCIGELVDNSIAATSPDQRFRIDIMLNPGQTEEVVDVYVVDNGRGMTFGTLCKAVQLGEPPTSGNRLNEHGFGLKNALATLSGGNLSWDLWTRHDDSDLQVNHVQGPFGPEMAIDDAANPPDFERLPADWSTAIHVPVRRSFLKTVQGRGAPARDLNLIREWLVEHLGVHYRGYLDLDSNGQRSGSIGVSVGPSTVDVVPVPVPIARAQTEYLNVEVAGQVVEITYTFGTLDKVQRDRLIRGNPCRFYYQGNMPTQGVDIRIGKRVIATCQLETIWKKQVDDREEPVSKHNRFNDFVGEIKIPDLPRGVLTTVNNKTDFNLDDTNWNNVFEAVSKFAPIAGIRLKTERQLQRKWIDMLKAADPEDEVTDEYHVWPPGARIDVFRRKRSGEIIVYELKVPEARPVDLYQLKMYWDGVVQKGENPKEGHLIVADYSNAIESMVNEMNSQPVPSGANPYNFKLRRHSELGL